MACGTTARVQRGAEATWHSRGWPTWGAGGAQCAATWQGATRPRGSTWQEGVCIWRAHGYSGALVREGGGNAIKVTFAHPYLRALLPNFFSVWDYAPTRFLPLQDVWRLTGRRMRSGRRRSRGPESTLSSNQARAQRTT